MWQEPRVERGFQNVFSGNGAKTFDRVWKLLPNYNRMAAKIEFYQIYWKESQKDKMYPFTIPYLNEELTPFFENTVISRLVKASEAEKIGVCSHELRSKLKSGIPHQEFTKEILESEYDVLSLTKNTRHHQMLDAAETWHKGFKALFADILAAIGIRHMGNPMYPIYSNHFIAKTQIYKDYVNEMLDPAMKVMAEQFEERLMIDSQYSKLKKASEEDIKNLKEKLGVPYYPMHAFICERFFSQWINKKELNVVYL